MLKNLKQRVKTSNKSKKQLLADEVKAHPAWRDDISLCEAAALLKNYAPFTYVLSPGMDQNHFFLSFVDSDLVVKHRNIRILIYQKDWRLKNGASTSYESIVPLIPSCLRCSENVCKPLIV